MIVLSTNTSAPQDFEFQGQVIRSSMIKKSNPKGLKIEKLRVLEDEFASPEFHGRPHSVVYAFSWPALQAYGKLIGFNAIEMGAVGENLSLSELDETQVKVGDQFQIGEVILQATSPRIPCSKLNFRFQNKLAQKLFIQHGKPGVYFQVLKSGVLQSGQEFKKIHAQENSASISAFYDLMTKRSPPETKVIRTLLGQKAFPDEFREHFQLMLENLKK